MPWRYACLSGDQRLVHGDALNLCNFVDPGCGHFDAGQRHRGLVQTISFALQVN